RTSGPMIGHGPPASPRAVSVPDDPARELPGREMPWLRPPPAPEVQRRATDSMYWFRRHGQRRSVLDRDEDVTVAELRDRGGPLKSRLPQQFGMTGQRQAVVASALIAVRR